MFVLVTNKLLYRYCIIQSYSVDEQKTIDMISILMKSHSYSTRGTQYLIVITGLCSYIEFYVALVLMLALGGSGRLWWDSHFVGNGSNFDGISPFLHIPLTLLLYLEGPGFHLNPSLFLSCYKMLPLGKQAPMITYQIQYFSL